MSCDRAGRRIRARSGLGTQIMGVPLFVPGIAQTVGVLESSLNRAHLNRARIRALELAVDVQEFMRIRLGKSKTMGVPGFATIHGCPRIVDVLDSTIIGCPAIARGGRRPPQQMIPHRVAR